MMTLSRSSGLGKTTLVFLGAMLLPTNQYKISMRMGSESAVSAAPAVSSAPTEPAVSTPDSPLLTSQKQLASAQNALSGALMSARLSLDASSSTDAAKKSEAQAKLDEYQKAHPGEGVPDLDKAADAATASLTSVLQQLSASSPSFYERFAKERGERFLSDFSTKRGAATTPEVKIDLFNQLVKQCSYPLIPFFPAAAINEVKIALDSSKQKTPLSYYDLVDDLAFAASSLDFHGKASSSPAIPTNPAFPVIPQAISTQSSEAISDYQKALAGWGPKVKAMADLWSEAEKSAVTMLNKAIEVGDEAVKTAAQEIQKLKTDLDASFARSTANSKTTIPLEDDFKWLKSRQTLMTKVSEFESKFLPKITPGEETKNFQVAHKAFTSSDSDARHFARHDLNNAGNKMISILTQIAVLYANKQGMSSSLGSLGQAMGSEDKVKKSSNFLMWGACGIAALAVSYFLISKQLPNAIADEEQPVNQPQEDDEENAQDSQEQEA